MDAHRVWRPRKATKRVVERNELRKGPAVRAQEPEQPGALAAGAVAVGYRGAAAPMTPSEHRLRPNADGCGEEQAAAEPRTSSVRNCIFL